MHCVCHVYSHWRIFWLSQAFLDFQKWMWSLKWGCFNARLGRGFWEGWKKPSISSLLIVSVNYIFILRGYWVLKVNTPNNMTVGTNESQCKALNQELSSEFPKSRKILVLMLLGLASFLCFCLLVTLFSVQISGTSRVHIEILNIFIQVLTQKSALQISSIKQPPVSALLLVFPLFCFPCQASDTSRAKPLPGIPDPTEGFD